MLGLRSIIHVESKPTLILLALFLLLLLLILTSIPLISTTLSTILIIFIAITTIIRNFCELFSCLHLLNGWQTYFQFFMHIRDKSIKSVNAGLPVAGFVFSVKLRVLPALCKGWITCITL